MVNSKKYLSPSPLRVSFSIQPLFISEAGCSGGLLNTLADEHNLDRSRLEIEVDLVAGYSQCEVQILELKKAN